MRTSLLLSLGACVAVAAACGTSEEPGSSSGGVSSSSGSPSGSSSGAASSSGGSGSSSGGSSSSSGGGQCGEPEFCATLCGTAPYSGCATLEDKCTCYAGVCSPNEDADAGVDAGSKCPSYASFGECKDFDGTTLCAIPPGSPIPR